MNTCQATVFQHAHAHTHKSESTFQGVRTGKKLLLWLMKTERGLVNPLAIGLGGLHMMIHFSERMISTYTPKSTRL